MGSSEKPTKLGTTSLILAIAIVVVWLIYLVLFALVVEGGYTFGTDGETAGYIVVLGVGTVVMILAFLLSLAGVITGLLALRKKDPKRGIAIAGLVLNFLCFAPYCLFFGLGLLGGLQTADLTKYIPTLMP